MTHESVWRILGDAFYRNGVTLFQPEEFVWEHLDPPPEQIVLHIVPTVKVLQALRNAGSGPITINSGYRPPWYNQQVGGSSRSQHKAFTAADFTARDWSPNECADWLDASRFTNDIGLGRYRNFTHVDTRHWPGHLDHGLPSARWDNR